MHATLKDTKLKQALDNVFKQKLLCFGRHLNSLPEYVTEQQGSVISECPVVIKRVDGGGQWLQDAVHNTGH